MESCKCHATKKLRKGLWSPEEDDKLLNHIMTFGITCWSSVPKDAGLQRCGKSCRLRWMNYLKPDIKRGNFSKQEEDIIISLHKALGNRWSHIASKLPGRTDNEVKNFWNSCLKKKLRQRGIDPATHRPLKGKDEKLQTPPKATQANLAVKAIFNPFPTFADQAGTAAVGSTNAKLFQQCSWVHNLSLVDQNGFLTINSSSLPISLSCNLGEVLDDPNNCGIQEISFSSPENSTWSSNWYTSTHEGSKLKASTETQATVSCETQHQRMSSDGSCSGLATSAWEDPTYTCFDGSQDGVPFEFDADLFDLLPPNN